MQKFKIKKKNILGAIYTDTIDGLPIKFPELPEVDFFIYQHDGSFGIGDNDKDDVIPGEKCKGKYVISECLTGMCLHNMFDNPEEAVFALLERIKKMTPRKKRKLLDTIEENKI